MGKWVHRISGVRPENKTAICAHCGPIEVKWNGARWQCREQIKSRHAGRDRSARRSRHHGLTKAEADAMKDGASCEICGSIEDLKIDHDHSTLKIRGVLCHHCNVAIGHMRDSPDRLRQAANYLEK